jgi:hypothetical protein
MSLGLTSGIDNLDDAPAPDIDSLVVREEVTPSPTTLQERMMAFFMTNR